MVILLLLVSYSSAFDFFTPGSSQFCFSEDMTSETLAVFTLKSEQDIILTVINPESETLYANTEKSHKYSFSALNSGVYQFCVMNQVPYIVKIDVDLRTGVKAKDYSGIASVKNLKEIELKLKKLDDQTKDVHKKIQFLREREEQLRGTNRTIHDRVITYSICTVVILLCLALIQILYLKNFFRAKKMI